jgi:hypothetical protein
MRFVSSEVAKLLAYPLTTNAPMETVSSAGAGDGATVDEVVVVVVVVVAGAAVCAKAEPAMAAARIEHAAYRCSAVK